jgi:transporter family-2 protein
MIFILIAVAIIIGSLMPIQAAINAELTRLVRHPYLGALISFTIGTLALSIMVMIQGVPIAEIKRLSGASPHLFIGGVLGALFVGASIFLIPKMGATTMIAAFVTGQLLMSVVIDHYGLLGLPTMQITMTRLIGIILLFAGLLLVVRKGA